MPSRPLRPKPPLSFSLLTHPLSDYLTPLQLLINHQHVFVSAYTSISTLCNVLIFLTGCSNHSVAIEPEFNREQQISYRLLSDASRVLTST